MIFCYKMSMKKLASILYLASFVLGSFCPMSMAAAMESVRPTEHTQMEVAVMSPNIPMTLAAPMSVAPVMSHLDSSPIAMAPGGCPGGNCIMMDHSQRQEVVTSVATIIVQGVASLPATIPSIADSLLQPTSPPYTGGTYLANIISTIVLRV